MNIATERNGLVWPILIPYLRVGMVALAALGAAGLLRALGQPSGIEATASIAALYLLPVNVVCLLLVRWLVHRGGSTLRAMIGFDRSRLGRDTLWGLLWIMVLYVPFAAAIIGTMFALYGADAFASFEAVFAPNPELLPAWSGVAGVIFSVLVVLTFAPINAPAEELVFRGYSQGRLSRYPVIAILLPSLAFGLQHVFFASTAPGMLVLGVAFLVWGIGSALIYLRQRRLMPLILAHFVVNLFTSLPALVVPFLIS